MVATRRRVKKGTTVTAALDNQIHGADLKLFLQIRDGELHRCIDKTIDGQLPCIGVNFLRRDAVIPDEVTIKILESEVTKYPDAKGVIYDGFPRTTAQAEALDSFLEAKGTEVTTMLSLVVPEDELKTRLLARAEVSGRKDDADPEIIQNRNSFLLRSIQKAQNSLSRTQ